MRNFSQLAHLADTMRSSGFVAVYYLGALACVHGVVVQLEATRRRLSLNGWLEVNGIVKVTVLSTAPRLLPSPHLSYKLRCVPKLSKVTSFLVVSALQ